MGEGYQDTGSQGLGKVEDGLGEGDRKQTTKGAGKGPDTWSWGVWRAKRETRGAIGDPRYQRWEYLGNLGKPGLSEGLGGGQEQVWGQ